VKFFLAYHQYLSFLDFIITQTHEDKMKPQQILLTIITFLLITTFGPAQVLQYQPENTIKPEKKHFIPNHVADN